MRKECSTRPADEPRQRLVVACFEVPGYGGASTSTYALFERLLGDGFDIFLLNLIDKSSRGFFKEHFGESFGNPKGLSRVHNVLLDAPIFGSQPALRRSLSDISPDALLAVGKVAAHILETARPDLHLIYYMSGLDQMTPYIERGRADCATELIERLDDSDSPEILDHREREVFERADLVIPHSDLAAELARGFFPFANWRIHSRAVWKGDLIVEACSPHAHHARPFAERRIDVLFVAADWERPVKNLSLATQIAQSLTTRNVHIVGRTPHPVVGATCHGLIGEPERLFAIMGDAKVLVCPSRCDAAPGVVFQGARLGCQVVASRNCGNWWVTDKALVADRLECGEFIDRIQQALQGRRDNHLSGLEDRHGYGELSRLLREYLHNLQVFNARTRGRGGVVYHLWRYPILSETFIQRELGALKRTGVDLRIVAESADDSTPECDSWVRDAPEIRYLGNRGRMGLSQRAMLLLLRHPVRAFYWYMRVRATRYHHRKSRSADRETWLNAIELAALAIRCDARHIHAPWGDRSAYVAAVAAGMAGLGFSLQLRAHDLHRDGFTIGIGSKLALAQRVLTNTRYNVPFVYAHLKRRDRHKLTQVYNGLELWRYPGAARRSGGGEFRMLAVGRITEQKGYLDLLRACARLVSTIPDLKLNIIGDTERPRSVPYERELMALHRSLKLEQHVFFLGPLSHRDVIRWMSMSDLFVLPCVIDRDNSRDIIPNAVIEAMAMELPVISTTVTGLTELVVDGKTGFLVAPGDVDHLARCMEACHRDAELRTRLGRAGRRRVEAVFDIDTNVAQYSRLFREVVTSRVHHVD